MKKKKTTKKTNNKTETKKWEIRAIIYVPCTKVFEADSVEDALEQAQNMSGDQWTYGYISGLGEIEIGYPYEVR
jgi:coenzyme F420-reducing hydrogenase beta subunit